MEKARLLYADIMAKSPEMVTDLLSAADKETIAAFQQIVEQVCAESLYRKQFSLPLR